MSTHPLMIRNTPTHLTSGICSWKNHIAAIIPNTYLREIMGYAMLKGKFFTIYIQSTVAAA